MRLSLMVLVPFFAAFGAGMMLPAQGAMNMRLAGQLGSPLWAAAFSLGSSCVMVALVAWMFAGPGGPSIQAPLWAWAGGITGAIFVSVAAAFTPRLGTASLAAAVMAGQALAAAIADHFGMFGLPVRPMDGMRSLGIGLVVAGAVVLRLSIR